MRLLKIFIMCFCLFGLASCQAEIPATEPAVEEPTKTPEVTKPDVTEEVTPEITEEGTKEGETVVEKNKVDLSLFEGCKDLRLSSYYGGADLGLTHYLKQVAPYDDSYRVKTGKYTKVSYYDADGEELLVIELLLDEFDER